MNVGNHGLAEEEGLHFAWASTAFALLLALLLYPCRRPHHPHVGHDLVLVLIGLVLEALVEAKSDDEKEEADRA